MDKLYPIFSTFTEYAKREGVQYLKQVGTTMTINMFVDTIIIPHMEGAVRANFIWNVILVVLIIFNKFVFSSKLFMLYYVASCSSTFYAINNLVTKIESVHPVIKITLPYTTSNIRLYLNQISILIAVETVGIFYGCGLDYLIYSLILILTVYALTINHTISLIRNIYKLSLINQGFRRCIYVFVAENMLVLILYGIMN